MSTFNESPKGTLEVTGHPLDEMKGVNDERAGAYKKSVEVKSEESSLRSRTLEYTQKFLKRLTGESDPKMTFQIFPDYKDPSLKGQIPKFFHCRLSEKYQEFIHLNETLWMSINVTVNQTDFKGRSKTNIERARAFFVDKDDGQLDYNNLMDCDLYKPNITVKTRQGEHGYWILSSEVPLELFGPTQKRLIRMLGTDPSVVDLPRVMRLPGFFHMKDPNDPLLVSCIIGSEKNFEGSDFIHWTITNDAKGNL